MSVKKEKQMPQSEDLKLVDSATVRVLLHLIGENQITNGNIEKISRAVEAYGLLERVDDGQKPNHEQIRVYLSRFIGDGFVECKECKPRRF